VTVEERPEHERGSSHPPDPGGGGKKENAYSLLLPSEVMGGKRVLHLSVGTGGGRKRGKVAPKGGRSGRTLVSSPTGGKRGGETSSCLWNKGAEKGWSRNVKVFPFRVFGQRGRRTFLHFAVKEGKCDGSDPTGPSGEKGETSFPGDKEGEKEHAKKPACSFGRQREKAFFRGRGERRGGRWEGFSY